MKTKAYNKKVKRVITIDINKLNIVLDRLDNKIINSSIKSEILTSNLISLDGYSMLLGRAVLSCNTVINTLIKLNRIK